MARDALLPREGIATMLLEMALELVKQSYPLELVRSLLHSLPRYPAAISARRVFRSLCTRERALRMSGKDRGKAQGKSWGWDPHGTVDTFETHRVEARWALDEAQTSIEEVPEQFHVIDQLV